MNKKYNTTFNRMVCFLLEQDLTLDDISDSLTLKKINKVKEITEEIGFKWRSDYLNEWLRFENDYKNNIIGLDKYVVAVKTYPNGIKFIIDLIIQYIFERSEKTIRIKCPNIDIFFPPGHPIRARSRLINNTLDFRHISADVLDSFIDDWFDENPNNPSEYFFVNVNPEPIFVDLENNIESIPQAFGKRISIKDLKQLFDLFDKCISYNIISNGKDEPQKGATIKGIIDFFEKAIGVNPLTIKKLKIKRKIDLEPNSISGPEAIELL